MKQKKQWFCGFQSEWIHKYYDSFFLMVGLTLLFFLCMSLIRADFAYKNALELIYSYHKEYLPLGVWTKEQFDEICDIFEGTGDNCTARDLTVMVGDVLDIKGAILYFSAEAMAKEKGIDLNGWNETPNAILVEGQLKKEIYHKNGADYIEINGMEYIAYQVINEREYVAQEVHVNWKNLDEEHKNSILSICQPVYENEEECAYGFIIESKKPFQNEIERFENEFLERIGNLDKSWNYEESFSLVQRYMSSRMKHFYLAMLFLGIYSLYFISEVWFARRKRELLIRRMLGCGFFSILWSVMKESGTIILMAAALATFIEMAVIGYMPVGNYFFHQILLIIVFAIVLAIFLQTVLFGLRLIKIMKTEPTQANIEAA